MLKAHRELKTDLMDLLTLLVMSRRCRSKQEFRLESHQHPLRRMQITLIAIGARCKRTVEDVGWQYKAATPGPHQVETPFLIMIIWRIVPSSLMNLIGLQRR